MYRTAGRRMAGRWITLAGAFALPLACNAILGNDVHELGVVSASEAGSKADAVAEAASDRASTADATTQDTGPDAATANVDGSLLDTAGPSEEADANAAPDAADGTTQDATADRAVDGGGFDASHASLDASDASGAVTDATDATDAGCPSEGLGDLSNIGTGDFHISFVITTTQNAWAALVNQRAMCSGALIFWDIRECTTRGNIGSCPVDGALVVETDDSAHKYSSCYTAKGIADGKPHLVELARISGLLTVSIDGAQSASTNSPASFGALAPVKIDTDVCVGVDQTTVPSVGTLSGLCITSP
jgi:hypothetical protein